MLKDLFGKRPTNKFDVTLSVVMAFMGVWKAFDTVKEFKEEQEKKENEK